MQAITRFNIAASFPVHKEATFAEISDACGLDEHLVRRILRHAMTKHIFKEARKGVVAHTAASRLLAENAEIHDWVGASTDELWQAASQTVNALVKYPGSQEPNQTVSEPFHYLISHKFDLTLRSRGLQLQMERIRPYMKPSHSIQTAPNDLEMRWPLSKREQVTTSNIWSATSRGSLSVMELS